MNGSLPLPTIDALKSQARRLRSTLEGEGTKVSHSKSLELLARQLGYRDWNTLHAAAGNRPPANPFPLGARVRGHYLGQPFVGEVIAVASRRADERYRITLQFDEPVDVVTFDSFSAFRRRVTCTLDRSGRTAEKTSDGRPHMELALA